MMHTDIIPLILLVGFGTSVFYLAISSIISFRRNLRIAKSSGLPYIVRPIAESSHTYLILQPLIDKFIDAVPQQLDQSGYLDYFRKDWRVKSKYDKHDILGDVFWNVSPGLLALEVADSNVFNEIITSRFRFQKDLALLGKLGYFSHPCPRIR
jgi:hypothetical protein